MPLRRQIAALPSLKITGLLLVTAVSAAILICAALFHQHNLQQQQARSQHYGQALANLGARQAVDATLNHDLVSLQILLSDIAANPHVIGATIHNVEHKLLVQGGHNPGAELSKSMLRQSFTAVISLQDSVAGYVTVTLSLDAFKAERSQLLWQFLWGGLALLLLLGTIVVLAATWRGGKNEPSEDEEEDFDNTIMPIVGTRQRDDRKIEPTPIRTTTPPKVLVCLSIRLHNLDTLSRQLNKQSFKTLLDRLEQQLNSVSSLYSGKRQLTRGADIELSFAGESLSDCSFRALCSAQLLLSLNGSQQGPALKLGGRVCPHKETEDLHSNFEHHASQSLAQQVLVHPELLSDSLLERVEVAQDEQTVEARLVQIAPPYGDLLDKQLRQLTSL